MHLHTKDGSYDADVPAERLFRTAAWAGVKTLSITEHDTVEFHGENLRLAELNGIDLISGVEISCVDFYNAHILGYGMNDLAYLNGYLGRARVEGGWQTQGYVLDKHEKQVTCANLRKARFYPPVLKIKDAIEAIVRAGGVPVAAHPWWWRDLESKTGRSRNGNGSYRRKLSHERYEAKIEKLKNMGVKGIECSAPREEDVDFYTSVAKNLKMIRTGGSDLHSAKNGRKLGTTVLTSRDLDKLYNAIAASNCKNI